MRLGRIVNPSTPRRSALLVQPGGTRTQTPLRFTAQALPIAMLAAVDSHTLSGLTSSSDSSSSSSSSSTAAPRAPPWRSRGVAQQRGRGRGGARSAAAATSSPISYTLDQDKVETYAAAGVLFYTASPDSPSGIQVLLTRQLNKAGSAWTVPGGKVEPKDRPRTPQVTAAREVEEETHDLVPAADLLPLLGQAPQAYYESGRYICYFVRLQGAQQVPAYYIRRVQGDRMNPAAAKCVEAAWFDLEYVVQSAANQRGGSKKGRVQLRYVTLDLGWPKVARWLRELVAGRGREQVLQWQPPPGESAPLEAVPVRTASPPPAAAAAPIGAQQEEDSSSSSQALTYREVAATRDAAAEQWRLANERLTQMLGALDVTGSAPAGDSHIGSQSGSGAQVVCDAGANNNQEHQQEKKQQQPTQQEENVVS